ncbi:MAG: aminotransferase class I/II-fold pyridoxal phosphate-dependent enzyme [Melioribacteraceae bacterium]|nr:aminotransferase class I/II-fold pyridoxal phosphate-dependent enzyme [Melioribacteraceae bacterium]MCF8355826.1 aminotransferase class I/II-fold pyridoxal phosphate-dependent enzyme [Melioribacteraceae bacterium]MCF8395281.1 aminotransferase class I/II-fold pyridoxal phosphate-dependent enzyme [Melioribacteraceae bacterium]MCF8420732.1 aminotransferase class I/II-fold pyridoxal phosphate-dependent enzyme [Melioribacteraceae bacterium]
MSSKKNMNMDSKCVHAGVGEYEYGPVVPPIYQTSTFKFESTEHGASLFKGEAEGYIYTRMSNPTVEAMENSVADLEGGYKALGCGSGMAAIHTALAALLNAGDHVVASEAVYGPTATLLRTVMSKFGITTTFVDSSNVDEVRNAVKPETRVIYIETPGNPTLAITDLEAVSKIARDNNAELVVDNTFMSPVLQQPIKHGADVVVHSMTKFLNGHADVVAGIIIVKDEKTYKHFRKTLNQIGGVIDPFNSFLVHRGIKTLALRMNKHSENAIKIAEWLENHPEIKWVKYPGLKSHPQYEIGLKQHSQPGGMITFELKNGFAAGETVMNNVKFCQLAVSLGGVETLIQHPASMTHLSMGKEAREAAGITEGLVRLSVGIENVDDIISDLEEAFSKITKEETVSV